MLALFISAFGLGLIFNAAPGPVFAETLRQSLRGGYKPALAVQFGSLTGDATWAILGLAGAGALAQIDALTWPLGLAGVVYLVWLSWDSWRSASAHRRIAQDVDIAGTLKASAAQGFDDHRGALPKGSSPLRRGMLLSLTNPQNLAYWAALGSAMAAIGVQQPQVGDYVVFFMGFMAASVAWCFICAGLSAKLLGNLGPRWAVLTYRLCAIALLLLALASLRDLIERMPRSLTTQPRPAITARP
jgi:chemosensory pili system protein ChpE/L-lysine exporter family protein LysE/ArgO